MDERLRFVSESHSGLWTMTELCERYEISRKTGYKWLERYCVEGAAGLSERSRAPYRHGRATPTALAEQIVALRQDRPSWGPRKIIAKLSAREPTLEWPSASTAGEILKRAGLVGGRRFRRRGPPRLYELTTPERANHVWGVDHKGWIRLGDGSRVEPLTITDGFSRFLLGLSATQSTRAEEARPAFERTFAEFGLPTAIRSDNGPPFASAGVCGLTALSAWWIKLGIRHERIDPGQPQQNGRHERFHLTLLEAMRPPSPDLAEQAARFARFLRDYNEERPHEALGQKTPSSLYTASERRLPDRLPEPEYPAEAAVRQVRSNGEIKWRGETVFVSEALIGEAVAVEETESGEFLVRFFDHPLCVIDQHTPRLRRIAIGARADADPPQPRDTPKTVTHVSG
ncbi:IS481 family transposase [Methylosinus sp. H3A]|uniref:IS481 family transposase n=1 Tax=Methylosinus sp. H3A TaxID=2785786 RepID=UPI0018C1D1F8|nr:IS481 family transposase [Methylosinus sp. H3A]MBG0812412.1 IS481 family transposase [Methylosinus sp. H3A]